MGGYDRFSQHLKLKLRQLAERNNHESSAVALDFTSTDRSRQTAIVFGFLVLHIVHTARKERGVIISSEMLGHLWCDLTLKDILDELLVAFFSSTLHLNRCLLTQKLQAFIASSEQSASRQKPYTGFGRN
ncbi:hypothetical protein D3C84_870550 [compost metagenome]